MPKLRRRANQKLVGGPQKSRAVFRKLVAERATQKPADGGMILSQKFRGGTLRCFKKGPTTDSYRKIKERKH